MKRLIPAALLLSSAFAAPALAQADQPLVDPSGEKVNQLIVYGNDPCPKAASDDEITVCARKEEAERFRIPEALRQSGSPKNDAWNNKVVAYEMVGRGGALSCSPTGAGGWTGCAQQLINKAYAEKSIDPSIRFGELIAAERERRLSTIDADAAATQARVEQAERDYDARERARQEQEEHGAQPAATPGPATQGK